MIVTLQSQELVLSVVSDVVWCDDVVWLEVVILREYNADSADGEPDVNGPSAIRRTEATLSCANRVRRAPTGESSDQRPDGFC